MSSLPYEIPPTATAQRGLDKEYNCTTLVPALRTPVSILPTGTVPIPQILYISAIGNLRGNLSRPRG